MTTEENNTNNNTGAIAATISKHQETKNDPLPECEEVTEEERQWMIEDIKNKTQSLQELLLNYRQMEDKLKEEVMECVLRDINEQNIHIGINKRVQTAQQEMLNDTAYVGWAMKNGKGEFASSFGAVNKNNKENKDGESEAPQQQPQQQQVSWKDAIIEKITNSSSSSSSIAIDPKLLSSSLPLSTMIVPPRISLVLGSFQEIDHEDSTVPETLKARFASFLTLVEVWKQRVEAQVLNGEPSALLLNGIPLFGSSSAAPSLALKSTLTSSNKSSSSSSIEDNISQLFNTLYQQSSNSIPDIFSMETDISKSFFNAVLKQGTNSEELMTTSGSPSHDTLSLVPLKQLQSSLLVYVVISSSQVVAIEPVISSFALHVSKGFASVNTIKQSVETFCQQMITPLKDSLPRRCVLTLALSSSSSSTILLDVTELTPHLPTSLLSWGDVCSILRQQQQNTSSNSSSSILFRGQKSRVASLEDAIKNEIEEDENNDDDEEKETSTKNNNTTAEVTVSRCFLQIVENTLNFDESKVTTTSVSSNSINNSYSKMGMYFAAGAALFAGAFMAFKRQGGGNNN